MKSGTRKRFSWEPKEPLLEAIERQAKVKFSLMSLVTQCKCYFWKYEKVCAEQKRKQKHFFVIAATFNCPLR